MSEIHSRLALMRVVEISEKKQIKQYPFLLLIRIPGSAFISTRQGLLWVINRSDKIKIVLFKKIKTCQRDCLCARDGINEPRHEISNNVVYATSKGSDQPAHTRSLIRAFASSLNIL